MLFPLSFLWTRSDKITVYGCSTGHKNPFTWAWVRETTLRLWEKYPTVEMMWYPFGYYAASDLSFTIFKALYHQFPAYLLDFCSFLVGKKRRWVSQLFVAKSNPNINFIGRRFGSTTKCTRFSKATNISPLINGVSSVRISSIWTISCRKKTGKCSTLTSVKSTGSLTWRVTFWVLDSSS